MGWFEEQLKLRQKKDDEGFKDAIESIAGAVMGQRLTDALDKNEAARNSVDEILRFFHYKMKDDGKNIKFSSAEEQLDYIIRPFGVMRRTVKLDRKWYKNASGPMITTFSTDGSAVALIPGKMSGYTYYDREKGRRVKINSKNAKLFDSEAVYFYKPLPQKKLSAADLLKFALQQLSLSDIALYIGMMALTSVIGLLSPLFTKWLFGTVIESGSMRVLLSLAAFMISYSVCSICISAFTSLINSRISIKQDVAVQAAVMNRVMSLPAPFFRDYSSGELTQRSAYFQSISSLIMNTVCSSGFSCVFSLIYIGQIFSFAPELAAPSLVIILASAVLTVTTTLMQMKITKEKMLVSSKTSGMTYSFITGIQKIKLAGAEKRFFSRWAKQYSKQASLEYNPPVFIKLSATLNLAITLFGSLLLYFIAAKSGVRVSDYYAFTSSFAVVSAAFASLSSIAAALANIRPALEMAKPIMEAEPESADKKQIITSLRGSIELNNVSFRYDENMPNVIDGLNLKINAGEYIAVVGATGCGKSTLIRLLLGFEKPQKGAIYYDRYDISRVDINSLRRKIGTVLQDGKLFLGDIYSNIVITDPSLKLSDAWEAAKIADIDSDIKAMPMGMHTIISEGQGGISGGQRQRLMIARAVAPKPKILIFDEATSALDNITQKKVSDAIDSLKCTRIVVAHRLSTIRRCDRIIVLDKGKIIEDGTYEQLIQNNAFFAELVKRQRLDAQQEEKI